MDGVHVARRTAASLVAAALGAAIVSSVAMAAHPQALGPQTWTWPSASSCNSTLQDCIDNAVDGDTVEIATDTAADEQITISKSLTLHSKVGFSGAIARHVVVSGTGPTLKVSVSRLEIDGGLQVDFSGGTGHQLTLDHLVLHNNPSDPWQALRVDSTVPATIIATSNVFNVLNGEATQVELTTSQATGTVTFRAVGNVLDGHGDATSFGGFQLLLGGHGTNDIVLDNNVIRDVGGCGCVGGSGVYYRINDPTTDHVDVVGNTIVGAVYGVDVAVELDDGGTYGLDLFDDIIARTSNAGVNIESFTHPNAFVLRSGYNDYFHLASPPDFGGYPAGSHNLAVAPRFVSEPTGNFALAAGSPLIDAGIVCSPGGIAEPDAAGHSRLRGPSTDIGALERLAGVAGRVVLGTNGSNTLQGGPGNDILCGYGGNDTLFGRAGDDYLDGGKGPDGITGGPGSDQLHGRAGTDMLCAKDGVNGNDTSDGGSGHDVGRSDPGDHVVSIEGSTPC